MNKFRERNNGWERDRFRGKTVERGRASFRKVTQWDYASNKTRGQQLHKVSNWRDHNDITTFYFTCFGAGDARNWE